MKWIKYIFLTIFFFISLVFTFSLFRGDTFVNYGFSYAISLGEIPYKDFNMVITPFSCFLYSLGLLIHKSILVYYLEQSILLVILFILLKKLLDKKVYLFFLFICIFWPVSFPTVLFPGYNFISFLLLILLVYWEEEKKSPYLIGIILGLLFCTKQTIGIALFIPSIIYLWKNKTIFLKRFIGFLIPIILLCLYLLLTNSIKEWFDLCFLGLFSFGNKNSSISILNLLFLLFGLIYLLYRIRKEKKNSIHYYFLFWIIVSLPIIDYYHVSLFLLGPLFLWLKELKIKDKYYKYMIPFIIVLYSLNGLCLFLFLKKPVLVNLNHFPIYIVSSNYKKNILELNNYLKKENKEIVYLLRGSENYMFKIMNNKKITYYDLPNYGNYGYNGEKNIEEEIKNMKNVLFVVDSSLCTKKQDKYQQYICSFKEIAIKNSTLIKEIGNYQVYERE